MTSLLAVIGHPIAHSLSPRMHGAAIAALGIDAAYLAIDVAPGDLAGTLGALRRLGALGLNVTLPHKQAVMPLLDRVEDEARAIGAVNTLVREGERWIGANTDAPGLLHALERGGVCVHGAAVLVVGAGGAAKAAVYGLGRAGASRIAIAARRRGQAEALAAELGPRLGGCPLAVVELTPSALRPALAAVDLLVQASSASLSAAEGERLADTLSLDALPAHALVVDIVYRPRRTAVLAAAQARGLRTLDGVGMLVHQGALALERWLDVRAPLDVMQAAVQQALAEQDDDDRQDDA